MATIVTQARNNTPWWAPLAVNVLGGLWNDWQQNERNKKESALAAEAAKILSPQVTEETPATSLPNMANTGLSDTGLLNMGMTAPKGYDDNGWASIFHKNYTPLTQFDLGTAGITPAMSPSVPATPLGLSNSSGNLSNWANAMRNSDSPLSQFDMGTAGIVPASTAPTQDTTSGTPAPAVTNMGRNTGLPTPLDFYRQYMELKGSKRFGMVGNEAAQKILEPLMKLLEATRQEELRNALANEYIAATDTAGRNNTVAGGLLRGTIGSDVFNSIRQANTPTPHFTDIGGAVVPSMFDPWTGQITRGDEWAKSPTPGEAATNAYNWAKLDAEMADKAATRQESARQANMANAYNYWNATGTLGQKNITGNDGSIYQYNPQTNRYEPTDIRGSAAISKFDEQVIKDYDSQLDAINKELNRLAILKRNSETHGYDTKEIDAQIKAQQEKQAQIQQSRTSYIANLQHSGRTQNTFNIVGGHNFTAKTANGRQYNDIINKYTEIHDVDPDLIVAMIMQESGFNPKAKSGAGAMGLMQLMPETAKELGVTDPYDPEQNIRGGIDYIAQQLRAFNGDVYKALWAYNAGAGNARKGRMPKPSETRKYISNVIANYRRLKGNRNQVAATPQVTGLGLPPVDPKYLQNQPPLGQSQSSSPKTVSGDATPSITQTAPNITAWRNKDGQIQSAKKIEDGIKEAEAGRIKGIKTREDFYAELRRRGYEPVMPTQNSPAASTDVPVLTQTPPSPISGDLGISTRTIGNDVTPDMATNTTNQLIPAPLASMPRSPEMPQASVQETTNAQQALAELNAEYPYFESDDVGPLYNNPFEDPDYSPIPNIDQPQLPPVFRAWNRYPSPLRTLEGNPEDFENPMRNVIPIPSHDPNIPSERRLLRIANRHNRYPFGNFA